MEEQGLGSREQGVAGRGIREQGFAKEQGSGNREQNASIQTEVPRAKKKLSYMEAREFATIEQRVEESDARVGAARARVEDPSIATDAAALQEALAELEAAERENEGLYSRWAELTDRAV